MVILTGVRPKINRGGSGVCCANCGTATAKQIIETYVVSKDSGEGVPAATCKNLCGDCLVGHDVPVRRASASDWCFGEVKEYDAAQLHPFRVSFLDDTEEWVNINPTPSRDYLKFVNSGHQDRTTLLRLEMKDEGSIGSFSSSSFSSMSILDGANDVPLFDDANILSVHSLSSFDSRKRAPIPQFCCSMEETKKAKPKAMMWTKAEDLNLMAVVNSFNEAGKNIKWPEVAKHCGLRNGKQCRERWINHLSLSLRTDPWNAEEDAFLFTSFFRFGKSWCKIARFLKGRTDNGTKNRFHHLKRRLAKDFNRQIQKYSSMSSMMDKESDVSADSDSMDAIQEKTRAVMTVLAAESKRIQYSHNKGYVFGPFIPVIDQTTMCKRCSLFIPSEQTGKTMCTSTGWCEACTRIPPYVALDLLRECLELRRDDDFLMNA